MSFAASPHHPGTKCSDRQQSARRKTRNMAMPYQPLQKRVSWAKSSQHPSCLVPKSYTLEKFQYIYIYYKTWSLACQEIDTHNFDIMVEHEVLLALFWVLMWMFVTCESSERHCQPTRRTRILSWHEVEDRLRIVN